MLQMASPWQQLESEGWERGENASGKKFYNTPLKNGQRKKIYKSRDIPPEYSNLKQILFPLKVDIISLVNACVITCACYA